VLCTLKSDVTELCTPESLRTYNGKSYWKVDFEVELLFGQTETEARTVWVKDGVKKYGPVSITYAD